MGVPAVLIATEPFTGACKAVAKIAGAPNIKWAIVPHPIGSLGPEELMDRAKDAVDQIVKIALGGES